uniref:Uncharacterized protein orf211 n=1 Tax=Desmarestia viridis TaxID=62313 RepID=Q2TUH3_9PHAE|nr:hypothetical protein DevioMp01 [Desmarestia viridis]AAS79024.1 hypothetical protein [Desmarestia viridis]
MEQVVQSQEDQRRFVKEISNRQNILLESLNDVVIRQDKMSLDLKHLSSGKSHSWHYLSTTLQYLQVISIFTPYIAKILPTTLIENIPLVNKVVWFFSPGQPEWVGPMRNMETNINTLAAALNQTNQGLAGVHTQVTALNETARGLVESQTNIQRIHENGLAEQLARDLNTLATQTPYTPPVPTAEVTSAVDNSTPMDRPRLQNTAHLFRRT